MSQQQTTIVVDTSVFIHDIHHKHSIIGTKSKHWEPLVKAQLTYLMSGDWLGEMKPDQFQVIFVTDSKPYWRSEYLLRAEVVSLVPRKLKKDEKARQRLLELMERPFHDLDTKEFSERLELTKDLGIHYKAGRKFPTYEFTKIKKLVLETIKERNWSLLGQKGYEADDVAACIVKVNSELEDPNKLLLLTIDSDWIGLINQDTSWYCMHGWFPRLRSNLDNCNVWAEKRLGGRLETFRDIWDIKGQKGDKSDNIPPSAGVLLPVIDLLTPPEEYRLWEQPIASDIKDLLEYPKYRSMDATRALEYIYSTGVNACIRSLDIHRDLISPDDALVTSEVQ